MLRPPDLRRATRRPTEQASGTSFAVAPLPSPADSSKSIQQGAAMAKRKDDARKTAPEIAVGKGGETHQTAGGDIPVLTTQQGIPVADDQNSLKAGARG